MTSHADLLKLAKANIGSTIRVPRVIDNPMKMRGYFPARVTTIRTFHER